MISYFNESITIKLFFIMKEFKYNEKIQICGATFSSVHDIIHCAVKHIAKTEFMLVKIQKAIHVSIAKIMPMKTAAIGILSLQKAVRNWIRK